MSTISIGLFSLEIHMIQSCVLRSLESIEWAVRNGMEFYHELDCYDVESLSWLQNTRSLVAEAACN